MTLEQHEQMFGFWTEARVTYGNNADKERNFEVLKSVPGIDPVLAVVDGKPEAIPEKGWIVNSHLAPGYGGVIRIFYYPEGSLVPYKAHDDREQYGHARVSFDLNGYGGHVIAYENPAFPHKDVEPYDRMSQASYTGFRFVDTEVIDLDNGGRILDERASLEVHGQGMFFSMDWEDIDRRLESDLTREIDINRVTADSEQLKQILTHLSYAMGMTHQGMKALLEAVAKKTGTIE